MLDRAKCRGTPRRHANEPRASVWFLAAAALLAGCTAGVKATPGPGRQRRRRNRRPAGMDAPVPADVKPTVDIGIPTADAALHARVVHAARRPVLRCDRRRLPQVEGLRRVPGRRPDLHGRHLRRGSRPASAARAPARAAPATAAASAPAAARRWTAAPARRQHVQPRRRLRARELHARRLRHPGRRRQILRPDRRRLRQDDRLQLRGAADLRRHRHHQRVRRSELRADHLHSGGRRPVLRADRQRLRQGARLPGHLPGRRRLPGEPRLPGDGRHLQRASSARS